MQNVKAPKNFLDFTIISYWYYYIYEKMQYIIIILYVDIYACSNAKANVTTIRRIDSLTRLMHGFPELPEIKIVGE